MGWIHKYTELEVLLSIIMNRNHLGLCEVMDILYLVFKRYGVPAHKTNIQILGENQSLTSIFDWEWPDFDKSMPNCDSIWWN